MAPSSAYNARACERHDARTRIEPPCLVYNHVRNRPGALLRGAFHGNQAAMDGFARVFSGVTSPAGFFSEENVRRIHAAAR